MPRAVAGRHRNADERALHGIALAQDRGPAQGRPDDAGIEQALRRPTVRPNGRISQIVEYVVGRRPGRIDNRLVAEMPPQRGFPTHIHILFRVDFIWIEVTDFETTVAE